MYKSRSGSPTGNFALNVRSFFDQNPKYFKSIFDPPEKYISSESSTGHVKCSFDSPAQKVSLNFECFEEKKEGIMIVSGNTIEFLLITTEREATDNFSESFPTLDREFFPKSPRRNRPERKVLVFQKFHWTQKMQLRQTCRKKIAQLPILFFCQNYFAKNFSQKVYLSTWNAVCKTMSIFLPIVRKSFTVQAEIIKRIFFHIFFFQNFLWTCRIQL